MVWVSRAYSVSSLFSNYIIPYNQDNVNSIILKGYDQLSRKAQVLGMKVGQFLKAGGELVVWPAGQALWRPFLASIGVLIFYGQMFRELA